MKKLLVVLCVFVLSFALSGMARAFEVNFDDLSGSLTSIPDGYGGYHWSHFKNLDATDSQYKKSGYLAGVVSLKNVVYNDKAQDASVSADTPFIFNGAYYTAAWKNGLHISVTGYLANSLVGSDEFVVSAYAPAWYSPSWSGAVDTLTFHSYGGEGVVGYCGFGNHFAMDNFSVAPVPLPPSLLLLAPGLLGVSIIRRRRISK
ncbi:hypothetical protein SAMN04489760_11330 [Syntrophus gentianae]|uniref:VPLPA-CTERM protein sorting domain-containing protein n=1 Tax=Syntrophus gentianae TaxID=43775 RepID=A0A1H7Y1U8_9BACT|nr:hypothetical protein [Syntrophus gentianae]SEM39317.1 hypothetical protein SAMN04489760_11330 [Syntrophus gentianae]